MTEAELISKEIRKSNSTEIAEASTFETHGVSKQDVKDFLRTREGSLFRQKLADFDPNSSALIIDRRAIEQIGSGTEIPRIETAHETLFKVVPRGNDVPSFSPFFARKGVFDEAFAASHNISDYFGLPLKSEAPRYDVYEMRAKAPTEIFIHRVAPTSELNGLSTKTGGAEQVLVPDRNLYYDPIYVKSIDNSLALQAERRVATAIKGTVAGAGVVLAGYDAYTTAEQYQSLSVQGNQFGADALLRRYEGRTAGGFIGSMAAGAAYGFVAGSETGPGAFLTGAVGGVVGAFAGEKIATMVNEHKVNHQTGTDGVGYAYENGQWMLIQHEFSPNNPAMPASYALPSIKAVGTPAPAEQLAHLEYQRMTAVTAVALGNPATQDTKNIDLGGTQWHATREGWAQRVEMPIVPRSHEFPTSIKVDKPAEARTSEELNQIAANRRFNNDHYSKDVSNAYVMDYYGKGWSANGPLPDVVTKPLGLSSEQHIKDPVTGNLWDATTDGHFSRENNHSVGRVFVRETVQASGEELSRLGQLQQSAVQSNEVYGTQLIAGKFEESRLAQVPDTVSHADGKVAASGPTASGPTMHDQASSSAPARAEDAAIPKLIAPITPNSSNREMFDAMMTAAQNMDVDAMRSVSQNYLQSAQGQAWLEQGQQLNQQQAMAQQQAAQQQAQASQGPVR